MDEEARKALFRHLNEKVAEAVGWAERRETHPTNLKHSHALARHGAGEQQHAECQYRHRGSTPRSMALSAAGRLSMGPWYILMDEFLASGETIVRNLQMGIGRGAAFGCVMDVGYLPDMFGHIAQMPQILRLAGFDDAVVWRGVPSQVTRNAFVWEAPDGSAVRAEYLPVGYSNGAALPDDAKALVRRTADHLNEVGDLVTGDLLCMNGSDHLMPQPQLGRVVAEANDLQDDLHFEVTSLPHYLEGTTTDGLVRVGGELRSGFRANMLMGVTSNRVDVKRRGAVAERELERRAEPLAALFEPPTAYPSRLLELAWREMVRNSAHDSICACSVDDVVDAVLHRYAEVRAIVAGLADRSVKAFALSLAEPGLSVLNDVTPGPVGLGRADRPGRRPGPGTRAGPLGALGPPRLDGARRQHRAHGARHVAGAQDQRRRLGAGDQDRGHRRGHRRHALRRHRGENERPHRGSQAGPLHEARGEPRRHGARRHGAAVDEEDRRPHRRGTGIRVDRLRGRPPGAPGRGDRARGVGHARQRAGAGSGRPGRRDLRPGRCRRLRAPRGRRRPRGLVQLLAAAAGLLGGGARGGQRAGRRAGARAGPGPHHRHLRMARPRRRVVPGARASTVSTSTPTWS